MFRVYFVYHFYKIRLWQTLLNSKSFYPTQINTAQCYQNKDEILSVVTSEAFLIHFLPSSTHLVCSHTSTLQPDPLPSITTTSCSLDLKCKNQDYLPRASKREEGKDNSQTVFLGLFVVSPFRIYSVSFQGVYTTPLCPFGEATTSLATL